MACRKAISLQIHLACFIRLADTNNKIWTEFGTVNDQGTMSDIEKIGIYTRNLYATSLSLDGGAGPAPTLVTEFH